MKNLNLLLIFFLCCNFAWAQKPRLVTDLIPGAISAFDTPEDLILGPIAGSKVLLHLYLSDERKEIWVSDGRAGGTQKLLDLGEAFLQKAIPYQQDQLLVIYRDKKSEIWRSDGTKAGTRLLFQCPSALYHPVIWKDVLYYASNNNTFLGRSNALFSLPLAGPKYEAKNIIGFEDVYGISQLTALPNRLIGVGSYTGQVQQLFSSDGTAAGTKPYFQLNPGKPASLLDPIYSTPMGNRLFFFYQTTFNGLYVTDGTAAGTRLLGRYREKRSTKDYQSLRSFIAWKGKFYFRADSLSNQNFTSEELHVSDGVRTRRLTFDGIHQPNKPEWFLPYQQKLYFKGYGDFDIEFVCSVDSLANTAQVAINHFELGEGASFGGTDLCQFQDSLFFSAWRRGQGIELWASKGNTASTHGHDLDPGNGDSWPQQLTVAGTKLFFTALGPNQGRELWVYDPKESPSTSTRVASMQGQVIVSPNPARENLEVQIIGPNPVVRINAWDAAGRVWHQQTLSSPSYNLSIEVAQWPKGLYLLELWDKNGARSVTKVITR
jgi:ELWxxDGT repeat protein